MLKSFPFRFIELEKLMSKCNVFKCVSVPHSDNVLFPQLQNHQTSPTTPAGSPKSPPFSTTGSISSSVLTSLASGTQGSTGSSRSAPPTPTHTAQVSTLDSLSSLHVDGMQSTVSSGRFALTQLIVIKPHFYLFFINICTIIELQ